MPWVRYWVHSGSIGGFPMIDYALGGTSKGERTGISCNHTTRQSMILLPLKMNTQGISVQSHQLSRQCPQDHGRPSLSHPTCIKACPAYKVGSTLCQAPCTLLSTRVCTCMYCMYSTYRSCCRTLTGTGCIRLEGLAGLPSSWQCPYSLE